MKEIPMRDFDFIVSPAKLLTPEIVQMVSSIHEHKGKQELFLEANVDELKTLLEVALVQSTGASNRIEGIFTSDKRLEELGSKKQNPATDLSRKLLVIVKYFPQFTKAMNISTQDRTLFCSYIEICTPIHRGLPVEVIRTPIM